MDNKSDDQLLIMQATIEASRQDSDMKMKKLTEDITATIASMMDQIKNSKSSPDKKGSPKAQCPTTAVPANKKSPPLEGGHYTKIAGMCTLKHEISSPKFYELLIKTELKGKTALDLKKFYNHIKTSLNTVTRLREDLLPAYQPTKRHSEFEEYFISYRDHPSYYWNAQTYNSIGHSLLVALTNDTCVKLYSTSVLRGYKHPCS